MDFPPDVPGWGASKATHHFECLRQNSMSSSVDPACKEWFLRLESIDGLFGRAIRSISPEEAERIIAALLLPYSHSGFLAAFLLSSGGQVPESYALMRCCLESAIYAFHVWKDPKAGEIWLHRMKNKKEARKEFQYRSIVEELETANPNVCRVVRDLYERAIDGGAHPNVYAVMSNVKIADRGDSYDWSLSYLNAGSIAHEMAMKMTAASGLAALLVHELIWHQKFTESGLSAEIEAVRTSSWVI